MKIKVSKATPLQIDYLMAKHLGLHVLPALNPDRVFDIRVAGGFDDEYRRETFYYFSPSTDWAQGGPLIDNHQIMFETAGERGVMAYYKSLGTAGPTATGPTHLIAAIRLIVEGSFSEVVEVPDELCQPL